MDPQQIDREMEEIDAVQLSPEQEASIDQAMRNARDPYDEEVALSAHYDAGRDLLLVRLKSGQNLAVPRLDLQDLAHVSPLNIGNLRVEMLGMALNWPDLNVDIKVDALRRGLYGSDRWMKMLKLKARDVACHPAPLTCR